MPASRIFFFARTSRWAIVASGTRKALAICGVSSPPSRRRVRATCASVPSAGWQQVNSSRSRSSGTAPLSWGSSGASSSAACACRASRVDSRRKRSIAPRRAVVTIQPPGFGGVPAVGQRSSACTKASWTASSARVMSPRRRTRVATARPYSSRKTAAMRGSPGALNQLSGSSWNGRTSTGPRHATAPWRANSRAASRSGALSTQNPPSCSLLSANGPSVVST